MLVTENTLITAATEGIPAIELLLKSSVQSSKKDVGHGVQF